MADAAPAFSALRGEVQKVITQHDVVCDSGVAPQSDVQRRADGQLAEAKTLATCDGTLPLKQWEQYQREEESLVDVDRRILQDVFAAWTPGGPMEKTEDEVLQYLRKACSLIVSSKGPKGAWVKADTDGAPLEVLRSEDGSRCDDALVNGLRQEGLDNKDGQSWPAKLTLEFDGAKWEAVWEQGWYLAKEKKEEKAEKKEDEEKKDGASSDETASASSSVQKEAGGDSSREVRLIRVAGGGEMVEKPALQERCPKVWHYHDQVASRRHPDSVASELVQALQGAAGRLGVATPDDGDARDVASAQRILAPVLKELERRTAARTPGADVTHDCAVDDALTGDLFPELAPLAKWAAGCSAEPPPDTAEAASLRGRAAEHLRGARFPVLWDHNRLGNRKGIFASHRSLLSLLVVYAALFDASKKRLGRVPGAGTHDEEREAEEEASRNEADLRSMRKERAELDSCITELCNGTKEVLAKDKRVRDGRQQQRARERAAYNKKKEECDRRVSELCRALTELKKLGEDHQASTVAIDTSEKAAKETGRLSEEVAQKLRNDLARMDRTIDALEQHVCRLQRLTLSETGLLRAGRERRAAQECQRVSEKMAYDAAVSSAKVASDYVWDPKNGEWANCRMLQPKIDALAKSLADWPEDEQCMAGDQQQLKDLKQSLCTRRQQCAITEEHFEQLSRMYSVLTQNVPCSSGDPFARCRKMHEREEAKRRVDDAVAWLGSLSDSATKLNELVRDVEDGASGDSGSDDDGHGGALDALQAQDAVALELQQVRDLLVDGDLPRYLRDGAKEMQSGRGDEYQPFKDAMVERAGGARARRLRKAPKHITEALRRVDACGALRQQLGDTAVEESMSHDGKVRTVAQAWQELFLPAICVLGLDMGLAVTGGAAAGRRMP